MTTTPLRANILLRPLPQPAQTGKIVRVQRDSLVQACEVVAVGPEVREVVVGDVVYVNLLTVTQVGGEAVVPESAVLAYAR